MKIVRAVFLRGERSLKIIFAFTGWAFNGVHAKGELHAKSVKLVVQFFHLLICVLFLKIEKPNL